MSWADEKCVSEIGTVTGERAKTEIEAEDIDNSSGRREEVVRRGSLGGIADTSDPVEEGTDSPVEVEEPDFVPDTSSLVYAYQILRPVVNVITQELEKDL
jgi:hypothetical protein